MRQVRQCRESEAEHFLARQQKKSLAICASSHEGEQRLFRSVQLSAAVGNQFVKRIKVAANHLSVLEAIDDLGTDIRTAADSRCVTEDICRLLNRFDYLALSRSALSRDFRARLASAHAQRAYPPMYENL